MSIEELLSLIETVLVMDEQGDRSLALDTIRDEVVALGELYDHQTTEVEILTESKDKLIKRNNELFSRMDISEEVEEEEEEYIDEDLYEDEGLFEDED